jgi:hypothetical protein
MWFGFSDDGLGPLAIRPVQFHDMWSRSRAISPERGLALAVMEQAITDLADQRFATGRRGQRLYWQAYDWVVADDREWPFSFVNLCDALGLQVEPARRRLLDPVMPFVAPAPRLDAGLEGVLGKAA